MGRVKRAWEEDEARGFVSDTGKAVCTNCFDDYGINQFIEDHQTRTKCSYCETCEGEVPACELDQVLEHILECIRLEWGHPVHEGLPYESREGGWQYSRVYDSWELLFEIGPEINSKLLFDDICGALIDNEWCERNPYSLREEQTLSYGWANFSEFVKNDVRYLFLSAKNPKYDHEQHDEMNPVAILDALDSILKSDGFVKEIASDTRIWRVRIVKPGQELKSADELGSPPANLALLSNRMSPAGIPMFYGAFDLDTAISETYVSTSSEMKAIAGVFVPERALRVIDLSELPAVPSLYDEYRNSERSNIIFLNEFIADFSKPIERKDRAHIDYVPTQIVTEYLRHIFRTPAGSLVDGLIYPSSRNIGKKAIVIFAQAEQCANNSDAASIDTLLRLMAIEERAIPGVNREPFL